MNKESYEKEINRLETKLDNLSRSLGAAQEKNATLEYELAREREQMMQGLIAFLNSVHSRIGGIQVDILKQLASINESLATASQGRITEAQKAMQKLIAIENKNSKRDRTFAE